MAEVASRIVNCPHCEDGWQYREADCMDIVEGLDNGHGMVERRCSTCGGNGWLTEDQAEQYREADHG